MDIFDVINGTACLDGTIGKTVIDGIQNVSRKAEARQACIFLKEHLSEKQKWIDILFFDRLIYRYVWEFGKLEYEKGRQIRIYCKIIWDKIMGKRNLEEAIDVRCAQYYVQICPKLQIIPLAMLTIIAECEMFSKEELTLFVKKYILNSHVKYEMLVAPKEHKYEGRNLIDIIKNVPREELTAYYQKQYHDYPLLCKRFKGDYCDMFYDSRDIPIGDDSIYKLAKS